MEKPKQRSNPEYILANARLNAVLCMMIQFKMSELLRVKMLNSVTNFLTTVVIVP